MVQDPNFWRRFSVAVHNDEAVMLSENSGNGKGETKHAYVVSHSPLIDSPSPSPSPITTPTSQCHLSPAFPPMAFTRPVSAPTFALQPGARRKGEKRKSHATSGTRSIRFEAAEEKKPEMIALHKLPSCPQPQHTFNLFPDSAPATPKSTHFAPAADTPTPSSKRASQRASRFRYALSSHPPSLPATPKSTYFPTKLSSPPSPKCASRFTFASQKNPSRLSLGVSLSGRPKSAFRFWTTITADVSHRDSWLEGQQRKARQRAYMCWAFWIVFLIVVIGGIAAVLVLRGKGII